MYLGRQSRASADGADDELVIGDNAIGLGAGLIVIGGTNHTGVRFPGKIVRLGDDGTTNYVQVSATGDVTFAGSAGFYPRVVSQAGEPGAGTGATQIDSGENIMWVDTNDSNRRYWMFNHGGTVVKVELT